MSIRWTSFAKYLLLVVVLGFGFFFVSIKIDQATVLSVDSAQGGVPGGCFAEGNRAITAFLFPFKEPMQCAWHQDDAYINLPYHFLVAGALVAIFAYVKGRSQKR